MTLRRRGASIGVLLLATAVLLAADLALFARVEILDADRFADHAVAPLAKPQVQDAIAERLVDDALLRREPDLVAARPLLLSAAAKAVGTAQFRSALRTGVEHVHRALLSGHDGAAIRIAGAGAQLIHQLATTSPALARRIPDQVSARIVSLTDGGVAVDAAQTADKVRIAGIVLPALAIALLAASVWLAPRRREAVRRAGVAMALAGLLLVAAFYLARQLVLSGVGGEADHAALTAWWNSIVGGLRTGNAVLAALGVAIAVTVAVIERRNGAPIGRRGHARAMPLACLAVIAAMAIAAAAVGGGSGKEQVPPGVCNGSAALCSEPLDEVVFPSTHNSFAGANVRGWIFPEQDAGIPEQLRDGIRGLWIDAYYGIPGRRVYTDTAKINPALNAQIQRTVGPKLIAAADRIRADIARPPAGAHPRIYLCHAYCELGAVDAEQVLHQTARFLSAHPGEALLIDVEDYVTAKDMVRVIDRSGLADYVYRGPFKPPFPTLGQMVDSGHRVVIVAEHDQGAAPWYQPFDELFKETPFDFKQPDRMSCAANRGSEANPLFLVNNWINTDPAPLPSNAAKVNARAFLLDRARRCMRRREAVPNAIAVDFYRQGDVTRVAGALNREIERGTG